jgi:hypothetical protein
VADVRVKLYGLIWMTRRRYLGTLAFGGALVALLLGLWWFRWPTVRAGVETISSPGLQRVVLLWNNLPWIVGILGALLALEAWIVLRKFARKEAEQRSQPPVAPPPAVPSPSPGQGEQK